MVYVFVLMVFTYYTVLINGLKNGETIGEEYLSFHGQIAGLVANFGLTLFLVIDMARGKSKLLNNRIRNIVLSFFSAMVVYVSARILYSPEQFPSYSICHKQIGRSNVQLPARCRAGRVLRHDGEH